MKDSVLRTGDLVLQSAERVAPFMGLMTPWIDGWVAWLNAHLTYVQLGDNYASVVQGAIVAYAPIAIGRWRMRQIRKSEAASAAPISTRFE